MVKKPTIICEVKFTEWTSDEKLRHPVFLRIRNDKAVKQTTMEAQKPIEKNDTKNKTTTSPLKKSTSKK